MNHLDYTEVITLLEEYKKNFSSIFSEEEKNLADELSNNLKDLEATSSEIIDINSRIFELEDPSPNTDDEIDLIFFKIKLQRADPNIPIKLDNATRAYQKSFQSHLSTEEVKKMENKLSRITSEFYRIAHRVAKITESLPKLKAFKATTIRVIRNNLIEHPEGKRSQVTYDTFSHSKNEGPYVKGLRTGDHLEHMDKGFKNNSEEFLAELTQVLNQSLSEQVF